MELAFYALLFIAIIVALIAGNGTSGTSLGTGYTGSRSMFSRSTDLGWNPASGLPMVSDGFDAGGNAFGSDNHM